MSGRRTKGGKAKIEMSKPELPAFLQRMREQIVANEDADRIAQSLKKRKERDERGEGPEEGPTIVKLGDEDLTEEEYNRMKLALETQYKLDSELKKQGAGEELDVDKLLERRQAVPQDQAQLDGASSNVQAKDAASGRSNSTKTRPDKRHKPAADSVKAKKLSYDDDEDDESDSSS